MDSWPLAPLERGKYGAILADPPWHFQVWYGGGWRNTPIGRKYTRATQKHYDLMEDEEIAALPVGDLVQKDAVLFMWTCWPILQRSLKILDAWGFTYKTCAFCWTKADASQLDMLRDDLTPRMGMGYWTRANTEPCLLATRGKPKRQAADVRQAIVEPLREHSRKPDGIHERIERLVAGPYVELFARQTRSGWDCWGNETSKFNAERQPSLLDERAA